jgi:hypothetical protein
MLVRRHLSSSLSDEGAALRIFLTNALGVVGGLLVAGGVALIYVPAGVMSAGAMLVAAAIRLQAQP